MKAAGKQTASITINPVTLAPSASTGSGDNCSDLDFSPVTIIATTSVSKESISYAMVCENTLTC